MTVPFCRKKSEVSAPVAPAHPDRQFDHVSRHELPHYAKAASLIFVKSSEGDSKSLDINI